MSGPQRSGVYIVKGFVLLPRPLALCVGKFGFRDRSRSAIHLLSDSLALPESLVSLLNTCPRLSERSLSYRINKGDCVSCKRL